MTGDDETTQGNDHGDLAQVEAHLRQARGHLDLAFIAGADGQIEALGHGIVGRTAADQIGAALRIVRDIRASIGS